jgi:hypothetical protein
MDSRSCPGRELAAGLPLGASISAPFSRSDLVAGGRNQNQTTVILLYASWSQIIISESGAWAGNAQERAWFSHNHSMTNVMAENMISSHKAP